MNEMEANDSRATATPIPDAAFDFTPEGGLAFRNSTNDPALPRFRTVELLGRNTTISDVDYFSFTGSAGEKFYFDADNDNAILCPPCNFDGAMILFSSTGAILAAGDDSSPSDFGNGGAGDPFIGVFTLPTTDTYFLAIGSGPLSANISPGTTFSPLTRPDGVAGGFAATGSADDRLMGPGLSSGGYLVLISRSGPAGSVPEPGTFALLSVAVAAWVASRRQRITFRVVKGRDRRTRMLDHSRR
jgi:hypothetical protein